MPININLLRTERGGNPEIVRDSEIRRCRDGTIVDHVIEADAKWIKQSFNLQQVSKDLNTVTREIAARKKLDAKCDCEDLKAKSISLKGQLPILEKDLAAADLERTCLLNKIGNIVDLNVLGVKDEALNEVVLQRGKKPDTGRVIDGSPGNMHHHEIMQKLQMVDLVKGSELAGHRGYYLKGVGVMLNWALVMYGQSFLRRKGYTDMQPPYLMKREIMAETAELADFNETLYKINDDKCDENSSLFLIATSEQPISAYHRGENIEPKRLPLKYAGTSTCFRREAGSHGKDMWGIFRIHQFEKVEQFVITTPDESTAMLEEMVKISSEFYESLGLSHRVISIVGGALNDAAAKKYDLEAWFPGYNDYRELVSCSNCTDFQSRALGIRLGHPKAGEREKEYVHMLNGTLVASQRTMCCILENYQTPTGVIVPKPLIPFMDGLEFLPFPENT